MIVKSLLKPLLAGLLLGACLAVSVAQAAETRRAFLVGNQRYADGYISPLSRSVNDAKDLAKDLEDTGFDKKNIKVVTDIKNKAAFDKEFDAFLKTVEAGDFVVFYFSGHGFGVEADRRNYLLFTDLKSPFTFTRNQLKEDSEKRNPDIIRLRVRSFLDDYQRDEVPQSGVATAEIEKKLAEKKPRNVLMILDACRSLARSDGDDNDRIVTRRGDVGSRLITDQEPPAGFMTLFAAQFGEQATESIGGSDVGRNSLFTEVLRFEMQRPGQTIRELTARVKLMVRAIALDWGFQQEPEFVTPKGSSDADDFLMIGSIGRERFRMSQDNCAGDQEDWNQIKNLRKRDLFERHRRRYGDCPTGEMARREIARLALSSEDPIVVTATVANRAINDCDRLAASDVDSARPPEVAGVSFDQVDGQQAVDACTKAIADNPRIARYLYNLGRAYYRLGVEPGADARDRERSLRSAQIAYDDASKRGYVSALNNLAVMYESGDGVTRDDRAAIDLLKRAADQGHPVAMYNLGLHYKSGLGVKRDWQQAAEYFARSAEAGYVSAMVELGNALFRWSVVSNPRRGIEWLQRAADAGSTRAKYQLGLAYSVGKTDRKGGDNSINSVRADLPLAMLWFGRMADTGDTEALVKLASIMQDGSGLASAQPEIAERYWRLAAYAGNSQAQVTFADRLRRGFVLVKQERGQKEAITLLQRAMSQGSAQAALALAQIYRTGELGQDRSPVEAIRLAYRAIDLAMLSDIVPRKDEPFPEVGAGHLLAEMAKNNEAVNANGQPLLNADEIDRLERYYGVVDKASGSVKIRQIDVRLRCTIGRVYDRRKREWGPQHAWLLNPRPVWIWDWGRAESPTEFQFRNLERETWCSDNEVLRRTMTDIFEQAKKSKVAFADLTDQKVKTASGQSVEPLVKSSQDRSRRRRRW